MTIDTIAIARTRTRTNPPSCHCYLLVHKVPFFCFSSRCHFLASFHQYPLLYSTPHCTLYYHVPGYASSFILNKLISLPQSNPTDRTRRDLTSDPERETPAHQRHPPDPARLHHCRPNFAFFLLELCQRCQLFRITHKQTSLTGCPAPVHVPFVRLPQSAIPTRLHTGRPTCQRRLHP